MWDVTAPVPAMYRENLSIAGKQFTQLLSDMKALDKDIDAAEKQLEMGGAPYTPGRWPEWKVE